MLMKIGILQTANGDIRQYGEFYNAQEMGLARALAEFGHTVKCYKFVKRYHDRSEQKSCLCRNAELIFIEARYLGNNGISNLGELDKTIELLICFSDIQLMVPEVYRWCLKNDVRFLPYVGVLESHSTSFFRRFLMKFSVNRCFKVYRKCTVLAKTPLAEIHVRDKGVKETKLVPVGLDEALLCREYKCSDVSQLRGLFQISADAKIILFVGRMEEEKQPLVMISVFREILKRDEKYVLFMVGRGILLPEVRQVIKKYKLASHVLLIEEIKNSEIWKLYRIADIFVNLNRNEIFGMCILEAMYYGCPVIAVKAPGPSYILENGRYGVIVDDESGIADIVLQGKPDKEDAGKHVRENFLWSVAASSVLEIIGHNGRKDPN